MAFYGSLLLLVVAVYAVQIECYNNVGFVPADGGPYARRRRDEGEKEGKHEYGHGYGGHGYGSGGGHYAIGFNVAELQKICKDNTECNTCFQGSQTITDKESKLDFAKSAECVDAYLSDNEMAKYCATSVQSMLDKDASNSDNQNVMHLYSFCMRASTELYLAVQDCNLKGSWEELVKCFSYEGEKKKGNEEGKKEENEEGTDGEDAE